MHKYPRSNRNSANMYLFDPESDFSEDIYPDADFYRGLFCHEDDAIVSSLMINFLLG